VRVSIVMNNEERCLARQCEDIRNEIRIATYDADVSRAFLNANEINHRYDLINPFTSIKRMQITRTPKLPL